MSNELIARMENTLSKKRRHIISDYSYVKHIISYQTNPHIRLLTCSLQKIISDMPQEASQVVQLINA